MSYSIIFHPKAKEEYIDGYVWYEKEQLGLGKRFETAVEQLLEQISLNPETYGYGKGIYREAKTTNFPYTIVFKISSLKNTVYISAIYHTRRRPQKKYRK